jgi:hypothetical protein
MVKITPAPIATTTVRIWKKSSIAAMVPADQGRVRLAQV